RLSAPLPAGERSRRVADATRMTGQRDPLPLVGGGVGRALSASLLVLSPLAHAGGAGGAGGGWFWFASEVLDYSPAPGQFVNNPAYNDPAVALGAPSGGAPGEPPPADIVSLGGFGGSITLRFAETVWDDPCNPFGVAAIVFGNALYVANNPRRRFAEAGHIEISLDANGNGVADDAWYVIRGSSLPQAPADALASRGWDNGAST